MISIEGIKQLRIGVKPVDLVDTFDWKEIEKELDRQGNAVMEHLLSPEDCRTIAGLYPKDEIFRSRVVMGRHGFGRGEYKYFNYPLPDLLGGLRAAIYPHLVPIANHWMKPCESIRGIRSSTPTSSRIATKPVRYGRTPLLLQYGPGDYKCLHQDLYGEHVFPLQLAILLVSDPCADFDGGEFVADGAASANADPSHGGAASPGRRRCFRRSQPACAGYARRVSRKPAPRRQPHPVGTPSYSRHHFPRRDIKRQFQSKKRSVRR